MWFKNLQLFRFSEPCELRAETLEAQLREARFRPCGSQELLSLGWTPPLGSDSDALVACIDGRYLISMQREERLLPAAVVRQVVDEKVAEIEEQQMRKVRKRERDQLRDEVLLELTPRAFTRGRRINAYIDPQAGWLVVDSASRKNAEDLTSLLRKTLGSLPVTAPQPDHAPAAVMTAWLDSGEAAPDVTVEDECELRDGREQGGVVRCKGLDLGTDEVRQHLATGKQVTRLALTWADRIGLVLSDDLSVRRLRFLDLIQDAMADTESETVEERLRAEFAIMSAELANLLPRLLELFGGERQAA